MTTRATQAQRPVDLTRLRRVRDRIDREHAAPLDVEALARDAHLSAGHLSRQFRLAYGESVYSYLMTRRIERAMALLRQGDLSVTEVAFAVGRSSLGTHRTRSAELVGAPPSVYRAQALTERSGLEPCIAAAVTDRSGIEKHRRPSRTCRDRYGPHAARQLLAARRRHRAPNRPSSRTVCATAPCATPRATPCGSSELR